MLVGIYLRQKSCGSSSGQRFLKATTGLQDENGGVLWWWRQVQHPLPSSLFCCYNKLPALNFNCLAVYRWKTKWQTVRQVIPAMASDIN